MTIVHEGKHTPGPWKFQPAIHNTGYVTYADDRPVCIVQTSLGAPDAHEKMKANGPLIAAATGETGEKHD